MTRALKSILRLTSLLLFLQFYATTSNAQVSDEQLKQDLLKLEQTLNVGIKTHDTTALKNIIGSEYQLTVSEYQLSGPRFLQAIPREQWLLNCFQWSFDSATHTQISLSSWGELAVFRSMQHFYNLKVGSDPLIAKTSGAWVTDLWMKRDNRWQLITRVSERLPAKQ